MLCTQGGNLLTALVLAIMLSLSGGNDRVYITLVCLPTPEPITITSLPGPIVFAPVRMNFIRGLRGEYNFPADRLPTFFPAGHLSVFVGVSHHRSMSFKTLLLRSFLQLRWWWLLTQVVSGGHWVSQRNKGQIHPRGKISVLLINKGINFIALSTLSPNIYPWIVHRHSEKTNRSLNEMISFCAKVSIIFLCAWVRLTVQIQNSCLSCCLRPNNRCWLYLYKQLLSDRGRVAAGPGLPLTCDNCDMLNYWPLCPRHIERGSDGLRDDD